VCTNFFVQLFVFPIRFGEIDHLFFWFLFAEFSFEVFYVYSECTSFVDAARVSMVGASVDVVYGEVIWDGVSHGTGNV